MKRLALVLVVGCGDNVAQPTPDAATPDAALPMLADNYARVLPGYATEAECRAQNPDVLFACTEQISLCGDGRLLLRFTDEVYPGAWTVAPGEVTLTFAMWSSAFSMDGTTVMTIQPDGSLDSDEVYGDRAFSAGGNSLCP